MLQGLDIKVQDKEVTTVQTISSIEILDGKVDLNSSASFPVKLYDENGNTISITYVKLEGEDYSNWGSNDEYVVNFILNTLGLVKA